MSLPEQNYAGSQPEPSSATKKVSSLTLFGLFSDLIGLQVESSNFHNKKAMLQATVSDVAKRYSFGVADSCVDEVMDQVGRMYISNL